MYTARCWKQFIWSIFSDQLSNITPKWSFNEEAGVKHRYRAILKLIYVWKSARAGRGDSVKAVLLSRARRVRL